MHEQKQHEQKQRNHSKGPEKPMGCRGSYAQSVLLLRARVFFGGLREIRRACQKQNSWLMLAWLMWA